MISTEKGSPEGGKSASVRFFRDASNRASVEMFELPSSDYTSMCERLAAALALKPDANALTCGLDQIFMTFRRGDQAVELCWDNWGGFFVAALTPESEPLVHEIGMWLQTAHPSSTLDWQVRAESQ